MKDIRLKAIFINYNINEDEIDKLEDNGIKVVQWVSEKDEIEYRVSVQDLDNNKIEALKNILDLSLLNDIEKYDYVIFWD